MIKPTIYKYPIDITHGIQCIDMPPNPRLLHAGLDPEGWPCVWAIVDAEKVHIPKDIWHTVDEVNIIVCGTGHYPPTEDDWWHLGTFNQGPYVWHVFTDNEEPTK